MKAKILLIADPADREYFFANPFKLEHLDFNSKTKSLFGSNPANPSSDCAQKIPNPLLGLPKVTENPFLDSKSGFGF